MKTNNEGQSTSQSDSQGNQQTSGQFVAGGSLEGAASMQGGSEASTGTSQGHTGEVPLTTSTEGVQAGASQGSESGGTVSTGSGTSVSQPGKSSNGVLRPPVDVIEDAQGITLLADMPGVSRDNLNLRLDAQSLTIEGAMMLDAPQQMEGRYIEVRPQYYERTFALSRELDGGQATAELTHGVLKIRIPKTREAAPRKIPVNVMQG